jgi:hypothetical protein
MSGFEEGTSHFVVSQIEIGLKSIQVEIDNGSRIIINWISIRTGHSSIPVILSSRNTKQGPLGHAPLLRTLKSKPVTGLIRLETRFTAVRTLTELDASEFSIPKSAKITNDADHFPNKPKS